MLKGVLAGSRVYLQAQGCTRRLLLPLNQSYFQKKKKDQEDSMEKCVYFAQDWED